MPDVSSSAAFQSKKSMKSNGKTSTRTKKKTKDIKDGKKSPDSHPVTTVGHVLTTGEQRSEDVAVDEDVTFGDLHLKAEVLAGLRDSGFYKPSPVQYQAIPVGKFGVDLIVQAKSGTGKTCVFTVLALEMVVPTATTTQVLVVAPTREIAVQISSVMSSIGRRMKGLKIQTFIGGTEVETQGVCHIAVGTPGRLHHLLSQGILCVDNVRLLVLDEADQLLDSFKTVVQQVIAPLPLNKQVICTSATYTPPLAKIAEKMMRSTVHISLSSKQLLAVTQYVHRLPYTSTPNQAFRAKLLHLKGILNSTSYNQCMIFTNSILKAESVASNLKSHGMPVACLCGGQTQEQRLKAFDDLVTHKCRIMVATDLAARGLDSPHVSLVISLEPPPSPFTYLHRVGRAGRFGSSGKSVILATQGDDWLHVQAIATRLDLKMLILEEPSLAVKDDRTIEVLSHLTEEQLDKWKKSTSHKLSYGNSDKGGPDVWDVKYKPGLEHTVESQPEVNPIVCNDEQASSNINIKDSTEQQTDAVLHNEYRDDKSDQISISNKIHDNMNNMANSKKVTAACSSRDSLNDLSNSLQELEGKVGKLFKFEQRVSVLDNKDDNITSLNIIEKDLTDKQILDLEKCLELSTKKQLIDVNSLEKSYQCLGSVNVVSMLDALCQGEDPVADILENVKQTPKAITTEVKEVNDEFDFHMKTIDTQKSLKKNEQTSLSKLSKKAIDTKKKNEDCYACRGSNREFRRCSDSSSSESSSVSCPIHNKKNCKCMDGASHINDFNRYKEYSKETSYDRNPYEEYYNYYYPSYYSNYYHQYGMPHNYHNQTSDYQNHGYENTRSNDTKKARSSNKTKGKPRNFCNCYACDSSCCFRNSNYKAAPEDTYRPYTCHHNGGYPPQSYWSHGFSPEHMWSSMSRFIAMESYVRCMARTSTLIARHQQQMLQQVHHDTVQGLNRIPTTESSSDSYTSDSSSSSSSSSCCSSSSSSSSSTTED